MDAEILGQNNYKALDLLRDENGFMERNRFERKRYNYHRNLQRAYIRKNGVLMKTLSQKPERTIL
jgi:hypothetical protein